MPGDRMHRVWAGQDAAWGKDFTVPGSDSLIVDNENSLNPGAHRNSSPGAGWLEGQVKIHAVNPDEQNDEHQNCYYGE